MFLRDTVNVKKNTCYSKTEVFITHHVILFIFVILLPFQPNQPLTIDVKLVKGFSLLSFFPCVPMWLESTPAWGSAAPRVSFHLPARIIDLSITFCRFWDCGGSAGLTGRLMLHSHSSLHSDALAQVNNRTISGDMRSWSHRLEDWRACDDTSLRWKPSPTRFPPEGIFHPRPSIQSDGGAIASAGLSVHSDECHESFSVCLCVWNQIHQGMASEKAETCGCLYKLQFSNIWTRGSTENWEQIQKQIDGRGKKKQFTDE